MGHAAGPRHPQTRLPRRSELTARRALLKDIGPFEFGSGRECTFPAALAEATGSDYDWLMGCSGAAFDAAIDADGWDPLAAAPRDVDTFARGARAAGVRLDVVPPPYDDEMRELVFERIVEAIELGLPPLVRGIAGPGEFGVIVGYDDRGPHFDCRTFFDRGPAPTRVGWEAFRDEEHGTPYFLDRTAAPDRAMLAREAVASAPAAAERSRLALRIWVDGLRDEARWTDARHTGSAAFADHAMRAILVDRRRAAARFLRGVRSIFATAPGADLVRAAESYGYAAEAAAKGGTGPFDGAVAMRFLDPGHRRGWANALETVLRHESDARAALERVR